MPSVTEIVAWWGAILSSIVFIWDIVKWRLSGPRLRLSLRPGMKSINIPEFEDKTIIIAEVVNFGDRPTTITHLSFSYYNSRWNLLTKRGTKSFIIGTPNPWYRIPFELRQGTSWSGYALQTEDIEKMAAEDYLVCFIHHTQSKRPLRSRVVIRAPDRQFTNAVEAEQPSAKRTVHLIDPGLHRFSRTVSIE